MEHLFANMENMLYLCSVKLHKKAQTHKFLRYIFNKTCCKTYNRNHGKDTKNITFHS